MRTNTQQIKEILYDLELSEWLRLKMKKFITEVVKFKLNEADWDGHGGYGITTDSLLQGFLFLRNIYQYILKNTGVELPDDFEINPSPDGGLHFSWMEGRTLNEIEQKIPVKKKNMEMLIIISPTRNKEPFYFSYFGHIKDPKNGEVFFKIKRSDLNILDYKQKDFNDFFKTLKTLA